LASRYLGLILTLLLAATMANGCVPLPEPTLDAMNERLDQISRGLYRVEINESPPANYTVIQ